MNSMLYLQQFKDLGDLTEFGNLHTQSDDLPSGGAVSSGTPALRLLCQSRCSGAHRAP